MGRLDVEIRHGHDGGGRGAVIALIAFIVLAVAGGAGHKALTGAMHGVLTAVEVVMWTLVGLVIAAVAAGVVLTVVKIRAAVRAACARRAAAAVIAITPDRAAVTADDERPALDAPRFRPASSGSLPGQWSQIYPPAGHDDDRRRYS
jgi:hypothetical protein